jgi:hypothetical protein
VGLCGPRAKEWLPSRRSDRYRDRDPHCGRFSSATTAACFEARLLWLPIGLARFTFDRVFVAERGFALL